ncbi:UNVERIFIED_CONTAM: hypothetical protein LK11_22900 [Mumia flava]
MNLLIGVGAVLCVVVVSLVAPRIGVAAPLLLVLLGVGISVIPSVPPIEVDPELILAVVLPPLLYSAAVSVPTMDFRRDFGAISGLSVVLVLLSSILLGLFFSAVVPGVELATGIALGAIVSPTDAVATGIARRLGVAPRVLTVLEGESMLNDGAALVLLRSAVAAIATTVSLWGVLGQFVWAVVAAVVIGLLVGRANLMVRRRVTEASVSTAISFVAPFVAYLPAEAVGASGLVAAVVAGLVTGQGAPKYLRPQDRLYEESNWRTIELLLEGGVFLLVGLELDGVLNDVEENHGNVWGGVGIAVAAVALLLVVRAAYVLPLVLSARRRQQRAPRFRERLNDAVDLLEHGDVPPGRRRWGPGGRAPDEDPDRAARRDAIFRKRVRRAFADVDYVLGAPLGWREGAVLVWAGLRGVVTVAAVQTLPADTPSRSLLVLIAFVVAGVSLLVQGGTMPWVLRALGLVDERATGSDPDLVPLFAALSRAAERVLDGDGLTRPDGTPYDAEVVRRARAAYLREQAEDEQEALERKRTVTQYRELRLRVIEAQREALLTARSVGMFSSAALATALAMLDAEQIDVEMRVGPKRTE